MKSSLARSAWSGLFWAATVGCTAAPVGITRDLVSMGTHLTVEVQGAADRAHALQLSERVVRVLEASEQRLSTWSPQGELARVQSGAAEASVVLEAEMNKALAWADRTQGAFEPRCGALVAAWGLRDTGRLPSESEQDQAARDRSIWDEGAWGKGAALESVLTSLESLSPQLRIQVDLGGQWLLVGPGEFEINVAHPDQRQLVVARLALQAGSVATSGNSERGVEVEGQFVGHVLDPRTGAPAPDFGSVTVVHRDPFAADVLATAFLVLGPEAALAWAAEDPDTDVLILERTPAGLRARASLGLQERLTLFPS